MSTKASTIINLAKSWLGKKESNGTHKEIIDIYNNHKPLARGYKVKYTDSWCATFISSLAIKCNATDIIPTECSCPKMIELFKNLGIWQENENVTPQKGWIIFYDWDDNGVGDNKGNSDHVGIVEKVNGSTITVIEGNKSNAVAKRTIAVNSRYIRGYAKPKYKAETVTTKKSVETIAKEVIAGKWGNGNDRKTALEKAGYNYDEVQKKVNELLKTPQTIKIGSKVKISSGAVYGGLSSTRGVKVPSSVLSKTYTVSKIQTNKNVSEALLKEINSWVAVKYLKIA